MKTVINTFINNTKLENDNYYLFLVPQGTNETENGYMPRSKQCGFIFLNAQSPMPPDSYRDVQLTRTMAHELGHGAFTLQHTFADYPALTQGSTDNLMDYGDGTTLWKYQWDIVHNPRIVLGLFEGDEAGASKSGGLYGYVISDPQAYVRMETPPNAYKEPREILPKGKEIVLAETSPDGKFSKVKFIDQDQAYFTSTSNISQIIKLEKREKYQVVVEEECMELPYSTDKTGHTPEKFAGVTVDKTCGNYYQIKTDAITNHGWWISRKSLMKMSPDLIEGVRWVSQFDDSIFGKENCFCGEYVETCSNTCCARAVKYLMSDFGVTPNVANRVCIAELTKAGDYKEVSSGGDFGKGLQILDNSVKSKKENGKPIMVGVHYRRDDAPTYPNVCTASLHYILIVGKGYDEELKKKYFRFFDVGVYTDRSDVGASDLNRLYIDESNKVISGTYRNSTYTITEVIPNN